MSNLSFALAFLPIKNSKIFSLSIGPTRCRLKLQELVMTYAAASVILQ
jgi:hypothetical protein